MLHDDPDRVGVVEDDKEPEAEGDDVLLMQPVAVRDGEEVGDKDALTETELQGEDVLDTELQADIVNEGLPEEDMENVGEAVPEGLVVVQCDALVVTDVESDGLSDGLEDTERDPLELKETVLDTVEQSVGDCVPEAVEDWEEQPELVTVTVPEGEDEELAEEDCVPQMVPLTVTEKDAVPHDEADADTLELGE